MEILGYGEDTLTLWALKNKLPLILSALNDSSSLSQCKAFFRPSFGRRGGPSSAQFGEFDFILLSEKHLYLGESKWFRSSEKIKNDSLELRDEQKLRHKTFKSYVEEWTIGNYSNWHDFEFGARVKGITKPIAHAESLLAANLESILNIIKNHFNKLPNINNLLLYFYNSSKDYLPSNIDVDDFKVVKIDYSTCLINNFVLL